MQKLNQIQAYSLLEEGVDATFAHPIGTIDQSRLIKMRINAPQPVNLYITPVQIDHETGEVSNHDADGQIFLAHVEAGFEQVEFYYNGSFCLNALGGGIWLDTSDNTVFNVETSDPTSFARLYEREERHPAILEMERMARYNGQMLKQQMAEAIADMERRYQANVVTPANAGNSGTTSDTGGTTAPVPPAPASGDQAATDAAASGTGGE